MSDAERRLDEAEFRGELRQFMRDQRSDTAELKDLCKITNGRVTSLEISRARNAWLMRGLTAVGLAALVKAFSHGGAEVLPK